MATNLATILFFNFSARLDRFGITNILFVTLFFIKQSRLATRQKSLVFKWCGIEMPGTRQNGPFESRISLVFGCWLYIFYFCFKKLIEHEFFASIHVLKCLKINWRVFFYFFNIYSCLNRFLFSPFLFTCGVWSCHC